MIQWPALIMLGAGIVLFGASGALGSFVRKSYDWRTLQWLGLSNASVVSWMVRIAALGCAWFAVARLVQTA